MCVVCSAARRGYSRASWSLFHAGREAGSLLDTAIRRARSVSQVYKADEALRQLNEGDVFGERCLLEVCKRHALATSDAAAA